MAKQSMVIAIADPVDFDMFETRERFVTVTGNRNCETLRALINAGATGVTPLERWATGKRLSHYVWRLRGWGLEIETRVERDGDATFGRYVLRSKVRIMGDAEAA